MASSVGQQLLQAHFGAAANGDEPAAGGVWPFVAAVRKRIAALFGGFLRPAATIQQGGFDALLRDYELTSVEKDHKSMSNSVIAFGRNRRTGTLVVFKVFLEYDNGEKIRDFLLEGAIQSSRGLVFERKMYEALAGVGDGMPNLVKLMATYRDTDVAGEWIRRRYHNAKKTNSDLERDLYDRMWHLDPNTSDRIVAASAIVTEYRPQSRPLWIVTSQAHEKKMPELEEMMRSFMFQTLYTLTMMHRLGFQHNDLHAGNILVDATPREKEIMYAVDGLYFRVPVADTGKVLLFDYDYGICKECGPNQFLLDNPYLCTNSGICPTLNERFDLYRIMHSTLSSVPDARLWNKLAPKFAAFCVDVMGKDRSISDDAGNICMRDDANPHECSPLQPHEPETVMTAQKALQHNYFRPYQYFRPF